jgi:hypothetical protein
MMMYYDADKAKLQQKIQQVLLTRAHQLGGLQAIFGCSLSRTEMASQPSSSSITA